MKTFLIVAFMLVSLFTQAQIHSRFELKGIATGEKYYGQQLIKTSVADVPGSLIVYTLKDKTIYMIAFNPTGTLSANGYIYKSEADSFISSFQKNYGIVFEKKYTDDNDKYYLQAQKQNHTFSIIVEINKYRRPSYTITAYICHDFYYDISLKEDLEKSLIDF